MSFPPKCSTVTFGIIQDVSSCVRFTCSQPFLRSVINSTISPFLVAISVVGSTGECATRQRISLRRSPPDTPAGRVGCLPPDDTLGAALIGDLAGAASLERNGTGLPSEGCTTDRATPSLGFGAISAGTAPSRRTTVVGALPCRTTGVGARPRRSVFDVVAVGDGAGRAGGRSTVGAMPSLRQGEKVQAGVLRQLRRGGLHSLT